MAASVVENILARVKAVLLAGSTAAGTRVYRARDDAFGADECPAINIRRDDNSIEQLGIRLDEVDAAFTLACHAAGATWETAADALHMAAHALLQADATLAALGKNLRCAAIEVMDESADQPLGRLIASYRMQVFINPADLTSQRT